MIEIILMVVVVAVGVRLAQTSVMGFISEVQELVGSNRSN